MYVSSDETIHQSFVHALIDYISKYHDANTVISAADKAPNEKLIKEIHQLHN